MDSLTHIALGACIGELYAGKKIGKKALLIGAIAQSFPDIDFIASFFLSPAHDLVAHRGLTHSFFFIGIISLLFAWGAKRWKGLPAMSFQHWFFFIFLEMGVHLFIDAFNAYGTAWFEPFLQYRVSFHTLFVADPLFSITLGVGATMLLVARLSNPLRGTVAWISIGISTLYLVYAVNNKLTINTVVEKTIATQSIPYTKYFSTPTPANTLLWNIVIKTEAGFYIGYRSIFDTEETIPLHYFEQGSQLLDSIADHKNLNHLIRFSEEYYIVNRYNNRLVFSDLRFGQMLGWEDPTAPFVFYYYLQHPNDNELLIQRGRFERWDKQAAITFFNRIKGH